MKKKKERERERERERETKVIIHEKNHKHLNFLKDLSYSNNVVRPDV